MTFSCPICDEVILDAVDDKPGEQAVECDGSCATWLHRRCAGLSKNAFLTISKSLDPFYCPQCRLNNQEKDINSLKVMVVNLTNQLSTVQDKLAELEGSSAAATSAINSYASAVSHHSQPLNSVLNTSSLPIPSLRSDAAPKPYSLSNRKFNLILFGLEESTKGTPRHLRVRKDYENACSLLSSINPLISELSICDCLRLGRYRDDRHRPVLVKLNRSCDVQSILSNRRVLSSRPGISIKPDLSPEERTIESLLLKERRSLINSGINSSCIKIRGNILFLNKNKHGTIVDSMFQHLPLISDMLHNPVPPLMTSPLMPLAQDSPSDPILDHSLSPSSSPSSSPPSPPSSCSQPKFSISPSSSDSQPSGSTPS